MLDKYPHTSIQCLTAIAQHHGLQINPERIIQEYALGEEEPTSALLLRIASEIGLKARADKLSWEGLLAQGGVFPLLAKLAKGGSVIIVGARTEEDGKVAVLDPQISGAAIDLLDREQFASTGMVT